MQRAEDDERVDAVQELRPELRLELVEDLLLHAVVLALRSLLLADSATGRKPRLVSLSSDFAPTLLVMMMTVLRKSTRRPLASRQVAVLQDLEQDVEHLRVRLLDLVEQHHGVALAADRLGQLAALLEADVAWRGADQPADVVALHELAHVDLDERVLGAEHELGEGLGQLRLAHAGGAQEDERADRAAWDP